jgi:hypothetical protein
MKIIHIEALNPNFIRYFRLLDVAESERRLKILCSSVVNSSMLAEWMDFLFKSLCGNGVNFWMSMLEGIKS